MWYYSSHEWTIDMAELIMFWSQVHIDNGCYEYRQAWHNYVLL
jgi:hypothetical protein